MFLTPGLRTRASHPAKAALVLPIYDSFSGRIVPRRPAFAALRTNEEFQLAGFPDGDRSEPIFP